jgi:hypothetical protein
VPNKWYSIGLAAVLFLTFKSLTIKIDVLWPWVLPPPPPFSGMSGGPSLGLTVDVMAVCMNGAWLPVCPLGGPVDDLSVFGAYGRKVSCDKMAQLIVSLRRSPLCLPIIVPLVPLV